MTCSPSDGRWVVYGSRITTEMSSFGLISIHTLDGVDRKILYKKWENYDVAFGISVIIACIRDH